MKSKTASVRSMPSVPTFLSNPTRPTADGAPGALEPRVQASAGNVHTFTTFAGADAVVVMPPSGKQSRSES